MEKREKVITVQIDEEFYDSLMANGGNGGGSATVDDIMWYLDIYQGVPIFNFTKGTYTTDQDLGKEKPIDDNAKSILAGAISSLETEYGLGHDVIVTNLNAPQSGAEDNLSFMPSRIRVSGTLKSREDEGFSKKVETFIANKVAWSSSTPVLWLEEEKRTLRNVYGSSYYLTDVKISAPNGIEIELPNNE